MRFIQELAPPTDRLQRTIYIIKKVAKLKGYEIVKEFEVILVWNVDRLGRKLSHLVSLLNEVHSFGCDLYIHQFGMDTTTPTER